MHPFCCISTVSERNPAARSSSSSTTLTESLNMPPPHPPLTNATPISDSTNYCRKSPVDLNSNEGLRVCSNNYSDMSGDDFGRLSVRSGGPPSMELLSRISPMKDPQLLNEHSNSVKNNDKVGNSICGILYKWVNYGKGWKARWFVLQDCVLSYYKIHRRDQIAVNLQTDKGSKIIGEESICHFSSPKNGQSLLLQKPIGEIHLKVSSIREGKSDDKRFSIFTGTKRLHLRAETKEDRTAWIEALQAIKDMFPRVSNSELMAPMDNIVVSTEKLRQKLLEEGVSEAAIQDSEQLMRSEFSALQNQVVLLKQKQCLLLDTLRKLEVHIMIRRKQLANRIQNSSSVSSPSTYHSIPITRL